MLEAASKQMEARQGQPGAPVCNSAFLTEWRKRFAERISADQFIDVAVPIYAKHFTTEELDQFAAIRIAAKQRKRQEASKGLLEKLQKEAIGIQSETIGATTQLGAKVGAELGQQIAIEHPDWCSAPKKAGDGVKE